MFLEDSIILTSSVTLCSRLPMSGLKDSIVIICHLFLAEDLFMSSVLQFLTISMFSLRTSPFS